MNMNLKPALKYRFSESLKGLGLYFAIMVAIVVFFVAFFTTKAGANGDSTLSVFGAASSIALFVVGICTVREHLRLCLQMGISRRTAFVSEAISAVLLSLCVSIGGELLMAAAQGITASRENIIITDLYQILYVGFDVKTLSFAQHIYGTLVHASLFLAGYAAGAFISLVFYRLPKLWKTVFAIGVPVLLLFVFPMAVSELGLSSAFSAAVTSAMNWLGASAVNWMLAFSGFAAVTAAINWLLIRKAPITAAVG